MSKYSANGKKITCIEEGPENAPTVLMLHGGPGYFWWPEQVKAISDNLSATGAKARLVAVQGRGCGVGEYVSPSTDLLDDNLLKRAQDLGAFDAPDILLGHSTGAMVALAAVMEGFVKPRSLVLLAPYTATLGEHEYWVTEKAQKYPAAFARFYGFMRDKWEEHKGPPPPDLRGKMYEYWGELFFSLNEEERLKAHLHYCDFHVIDCIPAVGTDRGEVYSAFRTLLEDTSVITPQQRADFVKRATINANWWRTNFQDGYPFRERLERASLDMPVHILSGEDDEITPPHTVRRLASILGVEAVIAPGACHLAEPAMPGCLQQRLEELLGGMVRGSSPSPPAWGRGPG